MGGAVIASSTVRISNDLDRAMRCRGYGGGDAAQYEATKAMAGPHTDEDRIGAQRRGFLDEHFSCFTFALHRLDAEARSRETVRVVLR